MKKKEIKKQYGLNDENFNFYLKMGLIYQVTKNDYECKPRFEHMILEKSTVFKYHFEDDFFKDLKNFADIIKHTGKVKRFTKEEIAALEEERKKKK